jgi:hypothetical protein
VRPALLVAAALGAAPARQAAALDAPRAKINAIDTSKAPELWLFSTVLDAKDRPVPPTLVEGVEVFMNGLGA